MVKLDCKPQAGEPVRVLHIVSGDLWAGAEMQVWQLLRATERLDTLVVHAAVLNPGQLAEKLAAAGVQVTVLDESRQSVPQLMGALIRLARRWLPDVIHTHGRKQHVLGILAAWASGSAVVGTIHGRAEFTSSQLSVSQRALRLLERAILARAHDRLVAVSDELADDVPGGRCHAAVIPNSVDVELVRDAAQRSDSPWGSCERIPIGFLGRLVPVKQVDRLLKMMALLEIERPGAYTLHIVGDGPLRDLLQHTASKLSLDEFVIFHGFKSNPLPLLARLQLLLFASAHEGLPLTALEALSLGVPIVSPPIGSLARLISESGVGRVANSDSPRDLADAVLDLGLKPVDLGCLRPSLLPERYHIAHGVDSTARLWREEARKRQ